MENHEIQNMLRPMLGKEWEYKGDVLKFVRSEIGGNTITIYTEGAQTQIRMQRADFMQSFDKIKKPSNTVLQTTEDDNDQVEVIANQNYDLPIQTVITSNAQYLAQTLLNNITKLKNDPKYIPQAVAIKDQVDSLIDLGKAEIQAIMVASNLKGIK
jgi:hypothetical protein